MKNLERLLEINELVKAKLKAMQEIQKEIEELTKEAKELEK